MEAFFDFYCVQHGCSVVWMLFLDIVFRYYFPRSHASSSSSSLPTTASHIPPPHLPSPPHPPSSLLPSGCKPLPDVFSGVVAYLHGYEGDEGLKRERERYVVAYDGDVTSDVADQTTHIIVRTGAQVRQFVMCIGPKALYLVCVCVSVPLE